jgi:hypothetical protein
MFSVRMPSETIFLAVAAMVLFAAMAEAQSLDWIEPSLASLPAARGDAGMAYDVATHAHGAALAWLTIQLREPLCSSAGTMSI